MAKIGLDRLVEYNGKTTTLRELDAQGLIDYKYSPNFYDPKRKGINKEAPTWFADIKGTTRGWEISQALYERKTNKRQSEAEEIEPQGNYECAECGYTDHAASECPNIKNMKVSK